MNEKEKRKALKELNEKTEFIKKQITSLELILEFLNHELKTTELFIKGITTEDAEIKMEAILSEFQSIQIKNKLKESLKEEENEDYTAGKQFN